MFLLRARGSFKLSFEPRPRWPPSQHQSWDRHDLTSRRSRRPLVSPPLARLVPPSSRRPIGLLLLPRPRRRRLSTRKPPARRSSPSDAAFRPPRASSRASASLAPYLTVRSVSVGPSVPRVRRRRTDARAAIGRDGRDARASSSRREPSSVDVFGVDGRDATTRVPRRVRGGLIDGS